MPTENRIDCPALHKRSNSYPFGGRVPRTVRMLKTVTADPMPGIGFAYIKGNVPVAHANQIVQVWTNSHGAVAAVMPDGTHLGLRSAEFEVDTWHDLAPKPTYLSGPMTGLPDLNFPAFNNMAAQLRAAGLRVINPAEIEHTSDEWSDCLRLDIIHLMSCGSVATLPGWQNSKGAQLEVHIADALGITVVDAHDLVSMEIAR